MEGLQRCQRMQTFEGNCNSTEETGKFAVGVQKAFFNVFLLNLCLLAARQKAEIPGGKNETDLCCTENEFGIFLFFSVWDYLAMAGQNVS